MITEDEIKQLDEVSALSPEYPGWIISFQNSTRLEPGVPVMPRQK